MDCPSAFHLLFRPINGCRGHAAQVTERGCSPVARHEVQPVDRRGLGDELADGHAVVEVVRLVAEQGDLRTGVQLAYFDGGVDAGRRRPR